MTCDEVKPLLNALLDGELDAVGRTAIDSHLKTCEPCGASMVELEQVRDTIRAEMEYYKAPPHLRLRVEACLRGAKYLERHSENFLRSRSRVAAARVLVATAAALIVAVLAALPFFLRGLDRAEIAAVDVISAHQRALAGIAIDVVSSDQHTVKPWFNGKVPFAPPVLDSTAEGFPLAGGRLDYVGGRPVAALVYRRRLHVIDVFVRPSSDGELPPATFERYGYHEISWTRDKFAFSAVSDLNQAELTDFVRLLQSR